MSQSGDKGRVTVGVTPRGAEALAGLMGASSRWFETEMDAYRVAIALALRAEMNVDQPLVGTTTKFNIGSLDPDGSLVRLITALIGSQAGDPVALAERLADQGLVLLSSKLIDEGERLVDVIGIPASVVEPQA